MSDSTERLLSIGTFAALTGLTVTTLRHYDDIGLLVPASVDEVTGYRRYEPAQAGRAGLIRRLRAADLPLDDVAETLAAIGDPGSLNDLLHVHQERLAVAASSAAERIDMFANLARELTAMTIDNSASPPLLGPIQAVRIFCRDLDVSRRFYGEQLRLEEVVVTPDWLVFDTGGVHLIVEVGAPGSETLRDFDTDTLIGRFCGFSFVVDDVAHACTQLRSAGVVVVGWPELMPWGGTLAHVADPDNNVLTLVQYPADD